MDLDDHVCLCFHISKRKLVAYLRTQSPRVASQLSQCGGAGTGCGWCVPYLKKLFETAKGTPLPIVEPDPSPVDYAANRAGYIASGGGTPPSAD